jgi:hypothetical protein
MFFYQPAARGILNRHVPAAKIHHLGAELAMRRVEGSLPERLAFCGRGQIFSLSTLGYG